MAVSMDDSFVPVCQEDGSYAPVQCFEHAGFGKQCWCVNDKGEEIGDTRTTDGRTPTCEGRASFGLYTAKSAQIAASLLHAGLLPCSHQADVRMRSHCLLRRDGNKSAASCQPAWCKLILKLCIHKLDASRFNNSQRTRKYQVAASLIFTDLVQLDASNGLDATW